MQTATPQTQAADLAELLRLIDAADARASQETDPNVDYTMGPEWDAVRDFARARRTPAAPRDLAAQAAQMAAVTTMVLYGRQVHGSQARVVEPEVAIEECWRGSFVMLVAEEECALIHPGDHLSEDQIAIPRVLHAGPGTELAAAAFVEAVQEMDRLESADD
jgi:hypothetical protein